MSRGTLYIVSAPSGAGKSSLINGLLRKETLKAQVSVSHTTREPRPGEVDGQHYHFVDKDSFQHLIAAHEFYEWAEVFGNFYGTSKQSIERQLANGVDVFLDIDWQGAEQIKKLQPEAVSIFILPPSKESLAERLQNRGQDSAEVIAARMDEAISEMSHYSEYDYLIINDDFDNALNDLQTILKATKLTTKSQSRRHQTMIKQLLAD
ncbi:guanylate kinase [Paraferrimonas sp. SM1919]|uniref:guanylate kinase n=1 Tax=Paraferrimonas sp. SM1919 TaxID=2662263 RepID=UPI0013D44CFB|nr:guanylate kinase [Paraferrimonas sp. SM1919]